MIAQFSPKAQRLLEALTDGEILQIQKENPFRRERNDKICELHGRGVSQATLAEVSGLSSTTIWNIVAKKELLRLEPSTRRNGNVIS